MARTRPDRRSGTRKRSQEAKTVDERFGSNRLMKIGFIVLATLFTCSLIAGSLAVLPIDDLFDFGDDDPADNIVDPNEDLIAELEETVEANPEDLESVILLANVMGNSGRLDEAIPYYERAVDMAPDDAGVRLDFARALADGGFHADAELQFERALELSPDSQEGLYYLASLYMNWDPPREDEAADLFLDAYQIDQETFIAEQARNQLDSMGVDVPDTASPEVTTATPEGD